MGVIFDRGPSTKGEWIWGLVGFAIAGTGIGLMLSVAHLLGGVLFAAGCVWMALGAVHKWIREWRE